MVLTRVQAFLLEHLSEPQPRRPLPHFQTANEIFATKRAQLKNDAFPG